AIEYLMTYGWMLLVVAIAGGAIFSTVGNQSTDSVSGFSGNDVVVEDFGISGDDELGLSMRNGADDEIVVSRVNVSDPDSGEWVFKEFESENGVSVGSDKVFELPNVSRGDGSNSLDVEVTYDSGSLSNLSQSGTVSGDLELTDSGGYEGLPEDDHEENDNNDGSSGDEGGDDDNGGSLTLLDTVNYTYDDSGDVQVNETTAGDDGYQIDLDSGFSESVEEIKIVEMHGADGDEYDNKEGGSGGYLEEYRVDVSNYSTISIWVGEKGESASDSEGWGRSNGGIGGGSGQAGAGGGSTEIWLNSDSAFVAAAEAGGGSGNDVGYAGGGGARAGSGGSGFQDNGESGESVDCGSLNCQGGTGGDADEAGDNGGQEINSSLVVDSGTATDGGSSDGHGWILLEYYG
ncbi:MAG: hypothetical protein ACLFTA_00265, partial [Candidatus Nanohaloarchaea archaeon]